MLTTFLEVVPFALGVTLVYALCRARQCKTRQLTPHWGEEVLHLCFVCYLAGLFALLLVPPNFWTNLRTGVWEGMTAPLMSGSFSFRLTLVEWLCGRYILGRWVAKMLLFNALLFVPLGFFLAHFFPRLRPLRRMLPAAIVLPLGIELLQPLLGRSFDVDDLLMNFLGILLGAAVERLLRRITR